VRVPIDVADPDSKHLGRFLNGESATWWLLRRLLDEDRESTDLPRRERRNKVTQLRPRFG
jgi:hypothetical protein